MKVIDLLKKSGYSDKAIDYYIKKVNVGKIKEYDSYSVYTGPCSDTMEIYLKIGSNVIKDAKFQAIGCAGAFASGSALMEIIKGKNLQQAEKINREDVINHLGSIPTAKVHCACLAVRTLRKAIREYKKNKLKKVVKYE